MKTIALLSDFGLKDNFVGVMKGVILTINPDLQLVDVTHQIVPHQIEEAAFILSKSYSYFPKGTIFLVVVDPGVGSKRKPIAIKTKNYYFIGPDNGVLSIAAKGDGIEKSIALENRKYFLPDISFTFHGRDIFSPSAAHISCGVDFSSLGKTIEKIETIVLPIPKIMPDLLEGSIIYIDRFGNLVTNITEEEMRKFLKGKDFVATLMNKKIKELCYCYAESKPNLPFLIEGGFGNLEISLQRRSAKDYFGIKISQDQPVTIKRVR